MADLQGWGGFYCQVGAGVEFERYSIGLGYSGTVVYDDASGLYLKVGFRFGGKKP